MVGLTTRAARCCLFVTLNVALVGCPGGDGGTASTGDASTTGMTGMTGTTVGLDPTDGSTAGTATVGMTEASSGSTGDGIDCHDTTGADPTGGDTDGPGVCACIPDDLEGEPSQPTCGETLCPTVEATQIDCVPDCGPDEGLTIANPEALECALTALRDGTPGIIRWHWSDWGPFTDNGYVSIQGHRTAVRRSWGAQDLCFVADDARFGALPGACVFAECLAAPSPVLRFDCLRKFTLGAPTGVCDAGWEKCDI